MPEPETTGTVTRRSLMMSAAAVASRPAFGTAKSAIIQKITTVTMPGEFRRPVSMNSRGTEPRGKADQESLARVSLSGGTEGIGPGGGGALGDTLLGINPVDVYDWENDRITGVRDRFRSLLGGSETAWIEGALLDAIGKLKGKPVYRLFGNPVRDGIDAYDSSLYFDDIAWGGGTAAIAQVAAAIRDDGYRALKLKVGRPYKWMRGEAGVERDAECFIAAREAVGSNFNLMADANNGYEGRLDWAVRFLKTCAPYAMFWIEEIFPEQVEHYQALLRRLADQNAYAPIADGESVRDMDEFTPYLNAGVYRYIQPDMRACGPTKILRAADMAAKNGISLVPHNWASEFGRVMSLHMAKLRRNIPMIEDPRFQFYAIDSSSYAFREGKWFVPEKPGWGIALNPNYDRLRQGCQERILLS